MSIDYALVEKREVLGDPVWVSACKTPGQMDVVEHLTERTPAGDSNVTAESGVD